MKDSSQNKNNNKKPSEEELKENDFSNENTEAGPKNQKSFGDETQTKKKEGVDWDNVTIDNSLASLVQIESAQKYEFVPFRAESNFLDVAVVNPDDINVQNALHFLEVKTKKKIRTFPISKKEFKTFIEKLRDPSSEIKKALKTLESSEEVEIQDEDEFALGGKDDTIIKEAPVTKMVEVILRNAIDGGASDVHIEPLENSVRVRYRVDGILYNSLMLPKKIGPAIVSRIKILSNLKIDEKRKPQDGRFRMNEAGRSIDFRVSTFPVSFGEKAVLRILDKKVGLVELEDLGLLKKDEKVLKEAIKEPYGIILVTGPTGSGKSTTLYSILKILNKEGVNIVTLEDPVEYAIEGISQSQVRPEIGYTFATGLRSILRQDPDIIMVGEIRDEETAELAIHAALTGHLVFSTLHTNGALGAIPRLVDMNIQPFLISSSLKVVMAQRLVRKICPNCKEEVSEIPADAARMISEELKKISKETLKKLEIQDVLEKEEVKIYHGKGCSECQGKGMKGRIGIFEIIEVDNKIKRIIDSEDVQEKAIEEEARKFGYTTMKQDGIIKVLKGITTIEEVQRVTEDSNTEEVIQAKGEEE